MQRRDSRSPHRYRNDLDNVYYKKEGYSDNRTSMGSSAPVQKRSVSSLSHEDNIQTNTIVANENTIGENRNNFRSNTKKELKMLRINYEKLQREHKCMYEIFMNDLEFRNQTQK